jgi:hypothetical protein
MRVLGGGGGYITCVTAIHYTVCCMVQQRDILS